MLFDQIKSSLLDSIVFGHVSYDLKEKKGTFSFENKKINKIKKINKKKDIQIIKHKNQITIIFKTKNQNYTKFVLPAQHEELIFGCGEQCSKLNMKGCVVPIFSQEQGLGKGSDFTSKFFSFFGVAGNSFSSYISLPVFTSSLGYSLLVDTDIYVEFSFLENQTIVEIFGTPKKIVLGKSEFPNFSGQIVKRYFPSKKNDFKWFENGLHLAVQGGSKRVLQIISKLDKEQIPLSSVWIQDWCGVDLNIISKNVAWKWTTDSTRYPQIQKFISELNQQKIYVLGYCNPFLHTKSPHFSYAKQNGFLIENDFGQANIFSPILKKVALVDLTNHDAFEWFKNLIISELVKKGFSGWMADFGEHMTPKFNYYDTSILKSEIHNRYIFLWNQLQSEIEAEYPDLFIFRRSSVISSIKDTHFFWTGDQFHDLHKDNGLPAAVLSMITLSLYGNANVHFDIGGFTTLPWKKRTKDILKRWLEVAVFTPLMRSHEGSFPTMNAQLYDDNFVFYTKKMLQVREILHEYIHESKKHNRKLISIPSFLYQDVDSFNELYQYQYMFGNDIIVCPPSKKKFSFYLPEISGDWVHIWTGKKLSAGRHTAESKDMVPVFYKSTSKFRNSLSTIMLLK